MMPSSASPVTQTLLIDGTYAGGQRGVWRSTGLYANAGELVSVRLPSSAASAGLKLRIGCHTDNLHSLNANKNKQMQRFPEITKTIDLDQELVSTAWAFGGLLYVTVPGGVALGSINVTISGAFMAPLFIHGKDSLADWQARLATSAAPWGELVSSKIIITVSSSILRTYAADPITIMNTWDLLMDAAANLSGIPKGIPRARVREERIVADRQISAGSMHSGYPIMGFEGDYTKRFLLVGANDGNTWGPFHEIGHNNQRRGWSLPGASCRTSPDTASEVLTCLSDHPIAHTTSQSVCYICQVRARPRATSGLSGCTRSSVHRVSMSRIIWRKNQWSGRRGWPTTERTKIT